MVTYKAFYTKYCVDELVFFVHNPTKCRIALGIWTEQQSRKYHFWAAHPKWVASIPGTRKTRSGRYFFLSTRFCLLAAMRFGRPKKRRGRGLDHSFATYALPPEKTREREKCHHSLRLFFRVCVFLCLAFFLFLRGGKECEWIASLPFFVFFISFLQGYRPNGVQYI